MMGRGEVAQHGPMHYPHTTHTHLPPPPMYCLYLLPVHLQCPTPSPSLQLSTERPLTHFSWTAQLQSTGE